jgi:hypothetical protein
MVTTRPIVPMLGRGLLGITLLTPSPLIAQSTGTISGTVSVPEDG